MSLEMATGGLAGAAAWRPVYRVSGTNHYVVVSTPAGDPRMWRDYLGGLREAYEYYGVGSAQRIDEARTAVVLTMYTAAGRPIAGGRALGPHDDPAQVDTLDIWHGAESVARELRARMADGLLDMEGVWVARDAPDRAAVLPAVQRIPIHAADLLGVRWGIGAAAEHSLPLWCSGGCEVLDQVAPVAYPDDRYITRLIVWDRRGWLTRVDAGHRRALHDEQATMRGVRTAVAG